MRRLLPLVLLAAPHIATAQIDADRPGLAMGTFVLDRGQVQVEMGLPDATVYRFGAKSHVMGSVPVMVRVGVGRGVEVRAEAAPLSFNDSDIEAALDEVEVSAKVRLIDGGGPARLSVVPSVFVPTGGDGGWRGGFILAAEADLTDALALATSASIETDFADAVVPVAITLDYAAGARTHLFGEVGATSVSGKAIGGAPPIVGVGLTQTFSSRAQGDVYVQRVLGQPVWNVGLGLAVRF